MSVILGKRPDREKPLARAGATPYKLLPNERYRRGRELRRSGLLSGVILTAFTIAIGGCLPHQDYISQGSADGVAVRYVGDVSETQPIAHRYCAQFEREAVLTTTKEDTAYFACRKANISP